MEGREWSVSGCYFRGARVPKGKISEESSNVLVLGTQWTWE